MNPITGETMSENIGSRTRLMDAKPCPFCGGTWILIGMHWSAICVDCGATGPDKEKGGPAGKAWQQRPIEDALTKEREHWRASCADQVRRKRVAQKYARRAKLSS